MSFNTLKTNRTEAMHKLISAADKLSVKYETDETYWTPTVDKAGNGYAVIRFLPACEGEDVPWIRFWDHGFKGPSGRWYIENSLTSIGENDPVSEYNSFLWNASADDNSPQRKQARNQKRRLHYVSNIEVISDSSNPANEGKVFKFKFGKKIWDKIDDLMHPQFPGESPINPFDFWGGANFKLKIRQVEGYRNYDKSEFEVPSPHRKGDDKVLEAIYKQLYPLKSLLDLANYKTYNELSKKLGDVLGEVIDFARIENESTEAEKNSAEPVHSPPSRAEAAEKTPIDEDAGGKDLSYFAKLANS